MVRRLPMKYLYGKSRIPAIVSAPNRPVSIVGVPLYNMCHIAEDASHGSGVASQFVGNDPQWLRALTAQESSKESLCGTLITMRLNQNVDHVARHRYCCWPLIRMNTSSKCQWSPSRPSRRFNFRA